MGIHFSKRFISHGIGYRCRPKLSLGMALE